MTSTTTPSWIATLSTASIATDLAAADVNGVVGEAGLAKLLTDLDATLSASNSTLTSSEFADLKTIAANLNNGLSTSAYLTYVFNAVVDGNAANATWTGGGAASGALGNLAVGANATRLAELVGKWFLGTDLPSSNVSMSGYSPFSVSYSNVSSPLFGASGPSMNDINQGYLGDCYFLSSCAELANQDASAISSMFTNNGNGTYGVRFFVNGVAEYVTVNTALADGGMEFNYGTDIWASLAEKAWAQFQAGGLDTGNSSANDGNSYSSIGNGGDPAYALEALTGASALTEYDASGSTWTAYSLNSSLAYVASSSGQTTASVLNGIIADLNAHDDVILSSYTNETDSSGRITLVSDHALSIYGYDSATGNLEIRNPWGTWSGQNWDTTFEVSLSTLLSYGDIITADNAGSSAQTNTGPTATATSYATTGVGQTLVFTLSTSAALNITAGAALTLSDGGTAVYAAGTGTTAATFDYTPSVGQNVANISVTGYSGTMSYTGGAALGAITNASNAVTLTAGAATAGSGEMTIGGNGATGAIISVQAYNDALTLQASSRAVVTGSGDTLTVGANVNFNVVGSNNTIAAGSGAVGLISGTGNVFTSSNETFYASSGVSATINGAANTFYATSGSDALTVNGSGSAGDYFAANNDTITFASGPGGYIVGAGDTIAASTGSIELTVGGNGAGGVTNNVNGSNDTLNLLASSRAVVTGSGDTLTVGANVNFSVVGSNNTIAAGSGAVGLISGTGNAFTSSNETFYASSGVSATINGAANTFYATSGSDALTVGGSGSAGDYFDANSATITFASGPGGYIVGAGNTIAASTGSIEVTVGGNGAGGVTNNVNGSNDTIDLLANSRESVTGSGDAISVGANVNFSVVGSNNTITASDGVGSLISGTGDTLALLAGAIGNTVYVDASTTQATIQNFGLGRTDVLDLLNGAGGYASAASVVSALASDGHGGTLLSLGAGGSIDFVGVATGTLTAASFKIG